MPTRTIMSASCRRRDYSRVVITGLCFLSLCPRPKEAKSAVLTLTPSAAVGISNNPSGLSTTAQTPSSVQGFGMFGLGSQIQMTAARSTHRVGYGFRMIYYPQSTTSGNQSHSLTWLSDFTLSARTSLHVEEDVSVYGFSSIFGVDPAATINVNGAPVSATASSIFNSTTTQSFVYQPNGLERYGQTLVVSYMRAFSEASTIPKTLRVGGTLRADRIYGANAYSLSFLPDLLKVLSPRPVDPVTNIRPTDQALTLQLLAGWRRDFSVTTSFGVEAGPVIVLGVGDSAAVGPAAIATLGYRWVPWYATIVASQQPVVNPYLGEVLMGDSVAVRLRLPIDSRETFVANGIASITYARELSPTHDFVLSPHAYTSFSMGASCGYRFERIPIVLSLDYTNTYQEGETTSIRTYPSTHRQSLSLAATGNFAWGEGNHGVGAPLGPLP